MPKPDPINIVGLQTGKRIDGSSGASTLTIELRPWRDPSGAIVDTTLTATREGPRAELQSELNAMAKDYRSTEIEVRGLQVGADGARATLVSLWDSYHDAEIERKYRRRHVEVIILDDPDFGEFINDPDTTYGLFEGYATWRGKKIDLNLGSREELPHAEIATFREMFADQDTWTRKAKEAITGEVYPTWRRAWARAEDATLSPDGFFARLRLLRIEVNDGYISFEYDDDDLLQGHSIFASGTFENGFDSARF